MSARPIYADVLLPLLDPYLIRDVASLVLSYFSQIESQRFRGLFCTSTNPAVIVYNPVTRNALVVYRFPRDAFTIVFLRATRSMIQVSDDPRQISRRGKRRMLVSQHDGFAWTQERLL